MTLNWNITATHLLHVVSMVQLNRTNGRRDTELEHHGNTSTTRSLYGTTARYSYIHSDLCQALEYPL